MDSKNNGNASQDDLFFNAIYPRSLTGSISHIDAHHSFLKFTINAEEDGKSMLGSVNLNCEEAPLKLRLRNSPFQGYFYKLREASTTSRVFCSFLDGTLYFFKVALLTIIFAY